MDIVLAALCGFLMDLALGDPAWMPHPVVGMGKCIAALERGLRRAFPKTPRGELAAGAVLAGVSDRPLGVDIEHFRPVTPRLMERLGADSAEEALRRWVRLEALAKQRGSGVLTVLNQPLTGAENASVQDLAVFPGCAAAAALGEGEAPGRVQIWTLEALLDTLAENL